MVKMIEDGSKIVDVYNRSGVILASSFAKGCPMASAPDVIDYLVKFEKDGTKWIAGEDICEVNGVDITIGL